MPTDIRIIHACDFIKATPEGRLDLALSKKLLIEIASIPALSADREMILDTRKAQSGMSVTDLWYLANELGNLRKALCRKTAILCPPEQIYNAEFFALCAQNEGFPFRAFAFFEDAYEWLTATDKRRVIGE